LATFANYRDLAVPTPGGTSLSLCLQGLEDNIRAEARAIQIKIPE